MIWKIFGPPKTEFKGRGCSGGQNKKDIPDGGTIFLEFKWSAEGEFFQYGGNVKGDPGDG